MNELNVTYVKCSDRTDICIFIMATDKIKAKCKNGKKKKKKKKNTIIIL